MRPLYTNPKATILKHLILCLTFLVTASLASAQFIVKDIIFSSNSVTDEGKVSGYQSQTGPYSIWLPDSANTIIDIGGIAPGNGVGGQARFSADGNFVCGTSAASGGAEMSRYDRSTDSWTALGSLGFSLDSAKSGGYGISGDGNVVAGNSWADTAGGFGYAHGVAYSASEGLMDLGTLFFGRSTRVNAVNFDGSVLVGWQDFNGPWKAAVWRKNPAGGYFPNEYILIDTLGNPNDEYNQIGECSAVTPDGNWIGGYGDFANNYQPWIWSRDSGVINLGSFPNLGNGFVSGISSDASVVVGWFDGLFFGDPQTPFIWTRAGGLQELNGYIRNVLGEWTDTHQVYTAECISPNGNYVAGYGVDTSTFTYFTYRISLNVINGIPQVKVETLNMYPNPSADNVTIENKENGILIVRDLEGRIIFKDQITGDHVLDISKYNAGIYFITVQSHDIVRTAKLIKN